MNKLCSFCTKRLGKEALTLFGAVYRYDDYDGTDSLNRADTRALFKSLRAWVEDCLRSRIVLEAT
ncbi:MAG: hypothetical protein ACKV22_12660 [Bryobacteraceae bacterium]